MKAVNHPEVFDAAGGAPAPARRASWRVGIAVVSLLIGVHLLVPDGLIGDGSYLVMTVGAAVLAWAGARRRPPGSPGRLAAQLIALGVSSSALADLIFRYLTWVRPEAPDISLADIPWLASYLGVAAAVLLLSTRRGEHRRIDRDSLIDAAVAAVVALLFVWETAIAPTVADGSVPVFVRWVWASYPILDSVLLALVIRALVNRRARSVVGVALTAGVVCWLASDFAFLLMKDAGGFSSWLDAGWMAGAALLALSAWPRCRAGETADEVGAERASRQRFALTLLPLLVPGALEIVGYLEGRDPNPLPMAGASAALVLLAVVRTNRLVRGEERTQAHLRSQERMFGALAANSSDAVIILDAGRRIKVDSPLFAALVGHPGLSMVGLDPLAFVSPVALDDALALFARSLLSPGEVLTTELQARLADDSEMWLSARMVNLLDDPDVGGVVINMHDITDRKRAEQELSHQAFHDVLTGLANRALFRDRVDHALRRSARSGLHPAVIYLDLDGFKTVNDSLGHEEGDNLLRVVAGRLLVAVRSGDTVARLGGDEFAILIEESRGPLGEASAVAQRILRTLAEPVALEARQVVVSASLGVACADPSSTASSLLRNADIAMYRAKGTGKGRFVAFDEAMSTSALERLQLETDLIGALDGSQFRLVYQPVVRLDSEELVGFEALLRWHHPTLGVVPPDKFIPITEENGLIVPIGCWVLDEACRTAARWQRSSSHGPALSMAVNVSARQLASAGLVTCVAGALATSGLDPSSLVLELTETVLVNDPAAVAVRLQELRQLGVRLAIDDFGTGYSSLSYLRQFPIDILKIDRSFVNTITDRDEIPAIVRGLLDLGRTLGLETIAEGVELDVQRDSLRDERCELAQGFLFARPLEPEDAEALVLGDRTLGPVKRAGALKRRAMQPTGSESRRS